MTRKEIYEARRALPTLYDWETMTVEDRRAHDALDFREFINDILTKGILKNYYNRGKFLPNIIRQYRLTDAQAKQLLAEQQVSFKEGKTVELPGKKIFVWADEKEISEGVWL